MAHITRIKASDSRQPKEPEDEPKKVLEPETAKKSKGTKKAKNTAASPAKVEAKPKKTEKKHIEKPEKKLPLPIAIITWPFRMIGKPFVALGKYIKSSWQELRQVRWPSGKATWKMALAVLVYSGLLIGIIMLLDVFFTWLFNLILA